jgi:hypothetical protein
MYNHAGALIVFNSFLPSGATTNTARSGAVAGINTLSEFFSNQFSGLLSNILSSAVEDVDFIDEIDFNLRYNVESTEAFENQSNFLESGEFRMRTSARLFERVEVDLGGNYGVGNATVGTESGAYFTGNFAIQYALTKDRRLVLRIYSGTDRVLEGQRFRSGVGLRYQQEFDSFDNFFKSLRGAVEKGSSPGS